MMRNLDCLSFRPQRCLLRHGRGRLSEQQGTTAVHQAQSRGRDKSPVGRVGAGLEPGDAVHQASGGTSPQGRAARQSAAPSALVAAVGAGEGAGEGAGVGLYEMC